LADFHVTKKNINSLLCTWFHCQKIWFKYAVGIAIDNSKSITLSLSKIKTVTGINVFQALIAHLDQFNSSQLVTWGPSRDVPMKWHHLKVDNSMAASLEHSHGLVELEQYFLTK
jgi:hypothetical protein